MIVRVCVCVYVKARETKERKKSQISEMAKIPSILEYDGVSISKQLQAFRRNLRPLSSGPKQSYHSKLA